MIGLEITHKEFIAIVKEKEKYKKVKENFRNVNKKLEEKTKNTGLNSVNLKT